MNKPNGKTSSPATQKLKTPPKSALKPKPKKLAMPPKTQTPARPIPTLTKSLPQTRLEKGPVSVQTGSGPFVTNGYHVLTEDSAATGLAVTPQVGQDEQGQHTENRTVWGVTHLPSGALIGGGHANPEAAHDLAKKLAHLRWTEQAVPAEDVAQARRIVSGPAVN